MTFKLDLAAIDDLKHYHERRGKSGWYGKAKITVSSSFNETPVSASFSVAFERAETLEAGIRSAMESLAGFGHRLAGEAERQSRASAAGREGGKRLRSM
jgi:hypothetical protein